MSDTLQAPRRLAADTPAEALAVILAVLFLQVGVDEGRRLTALAGIDAGSVRA